MANGDHDPIYYRISDSALIERVRRSGELWGKAKNLVVGNGPPCVKAYVGKLPAGREGFMFKTMIAPSAVQPSFLDLMAIWAQGDPGVQPVQGEPEYVKIPILFIEP